MKSMEEVDGLHCYIRDTFMEKYLPRKITSNSTSKKFKPVCTITKRYNLTFLKLLQNCFLEKMLLNRLQLRRKKEKSSVQTKNKIEMCN